jgi:hypothetical protein
MSVALLFTRINSLTNSEQEEKRRTIEEDMYQK